MYTALTMYARMYNVPNVAHMSVYTQKVKRSRMCERVTQRHNVVCHVLEL